MVVSIEGAEEGSPVVVVAVAVGKMPMLTLSFISITSTFTSSLLSLGEPCLERRPGFGFGLLPMNLRHQKKMFSQLGVLRGSVRFLFCLKKREVGRTKRMWAVPSTPTPCLYLYPSSHR